MISLFKALSHLPWPLLYGLGNVLRFLAFNVAGYRRKVIEKNLGIMFPDGSEAERLTITREFRRNFVDQAVEALKGFSMSEAELVKRVTIENPELLEPYIEREQPLLILTLHQANVEWIVQRIAQYFPCPVAGIYKPMHNPTADALIMEARARYGVPVAMKSAGREILRQRKAYRCMLLAADQSPISRDKRFWHPFFSRPAPFYHGPQTIAEATGNPVIFAHPRRLRRGYYSIRWEVLAEPPYSNDTSVLERFIEACERSIREQPSSWWISNKKWKSPKPFESEAFALAEKKLSV